MDTFDLDLDSLDLKTIDLGESKKSSYNNRNSMSYDLSNGIGNRGSNLNNNKSPNLTISTSNDDLMPPDYLGDDLGLSMIANKDKLRLDDNTSTNFTRNSSINSNAEDILKDIGIDINDDDILNNSNFDNITNIDLDRDNDKNRSGNMNGPSFPNFGNNSSNSNNSNNYGGLGGGHNHSSPFTNSNAFNSNNQQTSFEDLQKAKFELLCKFERLRSKGVRIPQTYSMSSDYDEMKYEYDRLVHQRKMDNSVKMQRRMLMSFVTGVEYLNNKFDPFDLQLDDWSENVHENADEFDDIFEDLYEKYKDSADMQPELRLLFALSGSAFMYHLQHTMFKSSLPNGLSKEVFRQNPDLAKQFQQATMNTMGQQNPGFAGFMGNFIPGMGGNNNNNEVPKFNPTAHPPFNNPTAQHRDMPSNGRSPDIDSLIQDIEDESKEINIGSL
jgi:hypothetical protein